MKLSESSEGDHLKTSSSGKLAQKGQHKSGWMNFRDKSRVHM